MATVFESLADWSWSWAGLIIPPGGASAGDWFRVTLPPMMTVTATQSGAVVKPTRNKVGTVVGNSMVGSLTESVFATIHNRIVGEEAAGTFDPLAYGCEMINTRSGERITWESLVITQEPEVAATGETTTAKVWSLSGVVAQRQHGINGAALI